MAGLPARRPPRRFLRRLLLGPDAVNVHCRDWHIGWMLALGAVMATEKHLPYGRRLAAPLGAVLLLVALSVAIAGTRS